MEQASLRLMCELSRLKGYELRLHSINKIGKLKKLLNEYRLCYTYSDYKGLLKIYNFLVCVLSIRTKIKESDKIILTGLSLVSLLAVPKSRKRDTVLAIHYHHEGVKSKITFQFLYWLANKKAGLITFPSNYIANEAFSICPSIEAKTLIVPNPLPKIKIDPVKRHSNRLRLKINQDSFLIGNAGWIILRKRFDIFIRVIHELSKTNDNVYALIVGGGDEEQNIRDLIISYGLQDRVVLEDWNEDMSYFYSSIDLLLFNTEFDALPTTPIEAMSCGIPVVASSIRGGLAEVMDDNCGYMIDEHDVMKLADACREVIYRRVNGVAGKVNVERKYTLDKTVYPIIDFFE
jgi:glycosyltransferase involved in cell wall biosynthesis